MKNSSFFLVAVLVFLGNTDAPGCTTVVVSGRATIDGRPLLWKNRDTWQQQNEVIFDDRGTYSFIGVVNAEASQRVWMGVNETGFCIENSLSRDLNDDSSQGPGNGSLIRSALESCATVADFERLLLQTNEDGRQTQGNFGAIDAHGGAMLFEVGSRSFRRFNANDPTVAPHGFIVRANASISGISGNAYSEGNDDVLRSVYSSKRYGRALELCERRIAKKLDVRYLLQQVARDIAGIEFSELEKSQPVNTSRTLNRNTTVSAVVFHGVQPGESPACTTMWTILGEPMFSLAVPSWVGQHRIASEMNGDGRSPICELSTELRRRNYQRHTERGTEQVIPANLASIEYQLLQIENETIDRTLRQLDLWRRQPPTSSQLWQMHHRAAAESLEGLIQLCQTPLSPTAAPESATPEIHVDFRFDDDQGTPLGQVVDSAGMMTWDGGISDCAVKDGCLRIRRNATDAVNRYVDLIPDVRTKSNDGTTKSHRGWIVVEIAGWDLRGETANEVVRLGFTSRPQGHLHVAGLQLRRTGPDEVTVDGLAFGKGGSPITTDTRWPAKQQTPVTFVIELDKVAGNNGEGDSGGAYRLFQKTTRDGAYTQIGQQVPVRRLRNGNYMHLHVEGFFAASDEYVDLDRIYYTTTNPLPTESHGSK